MENLYLQGSDKTPYFSLDPNGELRFGGISMPEDAAQFYLNIMDWISDYYRNPNQQTEITVSFRYLNSSSSSMIFKIFHFLNQLQQTGKSRIKCKWYYESTDEGMLDYISKIKDYANGINFEVYPVKRINEIRA